MIMRMRFLIAADDKTISTSTELVNLSSSGLYVFVFTCFLGHDTSLQLQAAKPTKTLGGLRSLRGWFEKI